MSRYIDADALKEWLDEYLSVFKKYDKREVKGFVEHQPSIDIVRCAECKHKRQCHKAVEHTTRDRTSVTIAYRPIEFCSYGEREGE